MRWAPWARMAGLHLGGDRPQVLADDGHAMAVRLQAQQGVELVVGVGDVGAVGGLHTARDPEQPVQPHDVVDAQQAGVCHQRAQAGDLVAVALGPASAGGAAGGSPNPGRV